MQLVVVVAIVGSDELVLANAVTSVEERRPTGNEATDLHLKELLRPVENSNDELGDDGETVGGGVRDQSRKGLVGGRPRVGLVGRPGDWNISHNGWRIARKPTHFSAKRVRAETTPS